MDESNDLPFLSVVIKTFNEEANIVADSLSNDRTVEVAQRYPVTVVRLVNGAQRRCGAGGQLGYQFAHGRYLLLLDGDMVLVPGFLEEAVPFLDADPQAAGVGGLLREKSCQLEFVRRMSSAAEGAGEVATLPGAGLYRMAAIRDIGYFTNRNLHSREEFDLGLRLRVGAGWRLFRLATVAVEHHGHAISSWRLLLVRWRSQYFHGYGELLRSAMGTPWFLPVLRTSLLFAAVVLWWLTLLTIAALAVFGTGWAAAWLGLGILPLPLMVQMARKRDPVMAAYSLALWNFHAAAMVAGLFHRQIDPRQPLEAEMIGPRAPLPCRMEESS